MKKNILYLAIVVIAILAITSGSKYIIKNGGSISEKLIDKTFDGFETLIDKLD